MAFWRNPFLKSFRRRKRGEGSWERTRHSCRSAGRACIEMEISSIPGRILADSANPSMQALRGNDNFQLSSPEDAFVVARFALLSRPAHLPSCIIEKSAGMLEKEDDTGEIGGCFLFHPRACDSCCC